MTTPSSEILDAWADANTVLGLLRSLKPGEALSGRDQELLLARATSAAAFLNRLNARRNEEERLLLDAINSMRGFNLPGFDDAQTGPFLAHVLSEMERRIEGVTVGSHTGTLNDDVWRSEGPEDVTAFFDHTENDLVIQWTIDDCPVRTRIPGGALKKLMPVSYEHFIAEQPPEVTAEDMRIADQIVRKTRRDALGMHVASAPPTDESPSSEEPPSER